MPLSICNLWFFSVQALALFAFERSSKWTVVEGPFAPLAGSFEEDPRPSFSWR